MYTGDVLMVLTVPKVLRVLVPRVLTVRMVLSHRFPRETIARCCDPEKCGTPRRSRAPRPIRHGSTPLEKIQAHDSARIPLLPTCSTSRLMRATALRHGSRPRAADRVLTPQCAPAVRVRHRRELPAQSADDGARHP